MDTNSRVVEGGGCLAFDGLFLGAFLVRLCVCDCKLVWFVALTGYEVMSRSRFQSRPYIHINLLFVLFFLFGLQAEDCVSRCYNISLQNGFDHRLCPSCKKKGCVLYKSHRRTQENI